jgi:RsiW-degrading membrane proteinase PrsW (M82 family)
MNLLILVIIAILPPIAFLLYIHHRDKIDPEPHGLIVKTLLLGAMALIPAGILEKLLIDIPIFAMGGVLGAIIKSFVVIAPIEEAVKLSVVLLFIWKNPAFNEENDGIVYVGATSIGFAMLENVLYVVQSGFFTGIMRAVTSVPLHTFTGVLMGYFVGIAKFAPTVRSKNNNIMKGFLIAYTIHAVYDSFVISETEAALLVVPLVVALFIFGIIYLKKGEALSARRWGTKPPTEGAGSAVPGKPALPPVIAGQSNISGTGKYKIIISRILFALCAAFWALLIIGIIEATGDSSRVILEGLAGGIMLTIIPVTIGIVLEVSYRRHYAFDSAG